MIDFPCDFPIKIIFKNQPNAADELIAIVRRHYPGLPASSIKQQPSQSGAYISITSTVHAQDQASLDALYLELTQHPAIVMVL